MWVVTINVMYESDMLESKYEGFASLEFSDYIFGVFETVELAKDAITNAYLLESLHIRGRESEGYIELHGDEFIKDGKRIEFWGMEISIIQIRRFELNMAGRICRAEPGEQIWG